MKPEVALAMLNREGRWLLQLRDDIEGIVHPGCWGLFGGHLEHGESAEQALRRELLEEIGWRAGALEHWFTDTNPQRVAHYFRSPLTLPLEHLRQLEGQDMVLASPAELDGDLIWSPRLRQARPLAPSLQCAVQALRAGGPQPGRNA